MAELHVFTDDVETYIAMSPQDAALIQREYTGCRESDQEAGQFEQVPDEKELALWLDEECKNLATKTCAQWIAERGRGFLCSTEY